MANDTPLTAARHYQGARYESIRGVRMAADFGATAAEYQAARSGAALFDRSDRGRIVLTGEDVRRWLHTLVTNTVESLEDGAGSYAFAVDVKGRILFDMNILCAGAAASGALWLDIDQLVAGPAAAHFDRYLFTEDVQVAVASDHDARLACSGPDAPAIAGKLGVSDLLSHPALASFPLTEDTVRLFRHDLTGLPGFELIVPRAAAAEWWDRLAEAGATPAGHAVLNVLRIEAGIPWLGHDLDDRVLPAETGQLDRAVSPAKGCYLGHEIIERMRSRGVQAQRLVRLASEQGEGLKLPAPLQQDGREVGRLTSLVRHPCGPRWVGLGYLKTAVTSTTSLTAGDTPIHVVA